MKFIDFILNNIDYITITSTVIFCFSIIPIICWNYINNYRKNRLSEVSWILGKGKIKDSYIAAYGDKSLQKAEKAFLNSRDFIIPNILLFLTIIIGFLLTFEAFKYSKEVSFLENIKCALFGFWGGYLWGVFIVIHRFRSYSMEPIAIHNLWLKIF